MLGLRARRAVGYRRSMSVAVHAPAASTSLLSQLEPKHIWARAEDTLAYLRGSGYAEAGLVSEIESNTQTATASVKRSRRYQVRLWLEDGQIQSKCSCPQSGFCKHCVAVALSLRERAGLPVPYQPRWEKGLQQFFTQASPSKAAQLLGVPQARSAYLQRIDATLSRPGLEEYVDLLRFQLDTEPNANVATLDYPRYVYYDYDGDPTRDNVPKVNKRTAQAVGAVADVSDPERRLTLCLAGIALALDPVFGRWNISEELRQVIYFFERLISATCTEHPRSRRDVARRILFLHLDSRAICFGLEGVYPEQVLGPLGRRELRRQAHLLLPSFPQGRERAMLDDLLSSLS